MTAKGTVTTKYQTASVDGFQILMAQLCRVIKLRRQVAAHRTATCPILIRLALWKIISPPKAGK